VPQRRSVVEAERNQVMEERRTRPATAPDFHRLADLAQERGLRLFRDGPRWYCSSASDAGGCHYVTGLSCGCPGFLHHQRCTHHAALLAHLGWLPEAEAEAPASTLSAVPPACFWCQGSGRIPNDQHERYDRCETCGGSGVRPSHHLHDAPPAPMVSAAA
jgi:hypothetical protein